MLLTVSTLDASAVAQGSFTLAWVLVQSLMDKLSNNEITLSRWLDGLGITRCQEHTWSDPWDMYMLLLVICLAVESQGCEHAAHSSSSLPHRLPISTCWYGIKQEQQWFKCASTAR